MNYCKVKFVDNKCRWYSGSYEIGDLVYCRGSQSGVLGKVIDISNDHYGAEKTIKVGHINLEDQDELRVLWKGLNKKKKDGLMN